MEAFRGRGSDPAPQPIFASNGTSGTIVTRELPKKNGSTTNMVGRFFRYWAAGFSQKPVPRRSVKWC